MAQAIETQGFKFEINRATDADPVFVEVEAIVSFSGLDGQASEIDVTHLGSKAKEFRMGLQDNGNYSLETNYLPDAQGQNLMRTAKASRDLQSFRATFSSGDGIAFKGYVLSATHSGGIDDKMNGAFTIRITGDITEFKAK